MGSLSKWFIIVSLSLLVGGAYKAYCAEDVNKVIYGDDDRIDVYETLNGIVLESAKSTAAMIDKSIISYTGNIGVIRANSLQVSIRACPKERFAKQPVAANCTGFLVKNDYVVTAGHCITNEADCAKYNWVFDYAYNTRTSNPLMIAKSSIYNCKRIISRTLDQTTMNDYALIQLDRPVTDRPPLRYRKTGQIGIGTSLYVVGHPSGLPTKIAGGAKVRVLEKMFFSANLDTYGGNSGSPVFNAKTGEVEGVLVRGDTDYLYDSKRGCRYSNVNNDAGGRGEDVTYITNISQLKRRR